jgi:hypothetical protein
VEDTAACIVVFAATFVGDDLICRRRSPIDLKGGEEASLVLSEVVPLEELHNLDQWTRLLLEQFVKSQEPLVLAMWRNEDSTEADSRWAVGWESLQFGGGP